MAFKPFDFFRKRQKLFLAVMAILAMFLFVIGDSLGMRGQGRGGGLGGWVRGLFGDDPDQVAKVGRESISFDKLGALKQQRMAVHQFVTAVQEAGNDAIYRKAGISSDDLRLRYSDNQVERQRFATKLAVIEKDRPDALKALDEPRRSLSIEAAVQPWTRFQQAFTDYVQVYSNPQLLQFIQSGQFGGMTLPEKPNESDWPASPEALVQFVWWLKKADDLGVVFSADGVKADLLRAGGTIELKENEHEPLVKEEELPEILRKNNIKGDVSTLLGWLGEELRVMVAQGTIQGPERQGRPSMMSFRAAQRGEGRLSTQVTPLDLWESYVDVKTQLEVGILPIAVNQKEFVTDVKAPTTEELEAFFKKYKTTEPNPQSDTPGFKIPRLYKVEFVYADINPTTDAGKYYYSWARTIQEIDPIAFFHEVADYYQKNRKTRFRKGEVSQRKVDLQTAAQNVLGLSDLALRTPLSPLAPAAFVTPPLPPPKSREEVETVQRAVLAALGSTAAAGPSFALPRTMSYLERLASLEEYERLQDVQGGIVDRLTEERAAKLLEEDLTKLKADLQDYGKQYREAYGKWRARPGARLDKTEAGRFNPPLFTSKVGGVEKKEPLEEYLKHFAEVRGLKLEGMKEQRPKADLFTEQGSTPMGTLLKPVFLQQRLSMADKQFTQSVADTVVAAKTLFEANREPGETQNMFGPKPREYVLYWKSAETEPEIPPLEKVRDKVLEAWKAQQARTLAEKYAQALAKKVSDSRPDGYRLLMDEKGYYPEKILSRYDLRPHSMVAYRTATIPVVEYPPPDFVDRALKDLKNPGDTMVITNLPKTHYYVLVLRDRKEPNARDRTWVDRFDYEVISPDLERQLQVNGMPLSDFVLRTRAERYRRDWDTYFKAVTKYNEDEAKKLRDMRD